MSRSNVTLSVNSENLEIMKQIAKDRETKLSHIIDDFFEKEIMRIYGEVNGSS